LAIANDCCLVIHHHGREGHLRIPLSDLGHDALPFSASEQVNLDEFVFHTVGIEKSFGPFAPTAGA
jgi:hypothetical protein